MSHVTNQKAIDQTYMEKFCAIFITRMNQRYAVKFDGLNYKTYKEINGKWERCENLSNFLVWNGELQGHDDISTLISE